MSSDEHDLQVILRAQKERELSPHLMADIVREMKSSLIFQLNWEELLQSAPTAIGCMGACLLASSSSNASIILTPPKNKPFDHLKWDSVQANLVECSNLGSVAFLEAESSMGGIQHVTQVLNRKINEIVACLSDPQSARRMLRPLLHGLRTGAEDCLTKATRTNDKFDEWLKYVHEMHSACVQEESTTRDSLQSNEIHLAVEGSRLDSQSTAVEQAKNASEVLAKEVKVASDSFKKASDNFPTGWEILAQKMVGDLAYGVTAVLTAGMSTTVNNSSSNQQSSSAASRDGNPAKAPQQTADPAYPHSIKIDSFLACLNVVLNGTKKDGKVDWETARGREGAQSGIEFIASMLDDATTGFSKVATGDEPSITLKSVLKTCSQVANGIKSEIGKSRNVATSFPADDSDQVKEWQSSFDTEYQKAQTLIATARSMNGSFPNSAPVMTNNASAEIPQVDANAGHCQAVLQAATNRLATTQQLLTDTQGHYVKATGMLLEQQNKLGEIQANLAKLNASNASLTEIKEVLIECIKLIITLKKQITNLVRFFNAISSVTDACMKHQVEPFLETIGYMVAADGTDPNKDLRVGNYTLADFQRSQVFNAALTIRSYFAVFGDISKMWVQLSQDNVLPGLALCDKLSVTTTDQVQMQRNAADLTKWTRDATARVKQLAGEKQREIKGQMDGRIQDVAATTRMIQAPPAKTMQAITAGSHASKQAAEEMINRRRAEQPLLWEAIPDDI